MRFIASICAVSVFTLGASAINLDGQLDGAYGGALALQQNPTQFGDNQNPDIGLSGGSELNGGYASIANGNLYIMLTGNLESNFNKLELFIDSNATGQNQLRNDNLDLDFNGLNRQAGLKFDDGFNANWWLTLTGGNDPYESFFNATRILTNGGSPSGVDGFQGGGVGNLINGSNGMNVAIDNSNVGGVDGANVNDPSTVTTGIEFEIPLTLLGITDPLGDIKIAAYINGGGHDFASNQFLGSLPAGTGNLGEPSNIDLSAIDGQQYFSLQAPEPTSLLLLGLGALIARRR